MVTEMDENVKKYSELFRLDVRGGRSKQKYGGMKIGVVQNADTKHFCIICHYVTLMINRNFRNIVRDLL